MKSLALSSVLLGDYSMGNPPESTATYGSLPHLFSPLWIFRGHHYTDLIHQVLLECFITYTACGEVWGSIRQCLTPRSLWPGHTRLSLYLDFIRLQTFIIHSFFSWAPRWSFSSSTSWPLCMSSSGLQNLHSQIHFFSSSHYSVLRLETWETFFHFFLSCPLLLLPHAVVPEFSIFWNSLQMHPLLSILTVTSLAEMDIVIWTIRLIFDSDIPDSWQASPSVHFPH